MRLIMVILVLFFVYNTAFFITHFVYAVQIKNKFEGSEKCWVNQFHDEPEVIRITMYHYIFRAILLFVLVIWLIESTVLLLY